MVRSLSSLHVKGSKPDIFLMSTPRSGSTWLMEIVAAERHVRPCSEPLNIRKPFISRRLGIDDWDTLLEPESLPRIERYLSRISRGHIRYGFRNPKPFEAGYDVWTNRTVFKVLFACEHQLAWLRERFGAQIVCLVRHPIPVALSREKLPRLHALLARASADMTDEQRRMARSIVDSSSHLEQAVLDWCLQNRPLFDSATTADLFVTYEQLVLEPDVIVDRLVDVLDLESSEAIRSRVRRLSASVSRSSDTSIELLRHRRDNADALISKWRKAVSDVEERALMQIVAQFGITAYAPGGLLPAPEYWIHPAGGPDRRAANVR